MKKNTILYGKAETPMQKKAISLLSALLLEYTSEYPAVFSASVGAERENDRLFYIGTREDHSVFCEAADTPLTHPEEYRITVKNDTVYIEGFDDAGVLYGCIDFFDRYIVKHEYTHDDRYRIDPLSETLPDVSFSSYPKVKNRGLWTWGHVLCDYRGYLDHMARLKLNTLTIWNDRVPFNAREIVEYAHALGIRIIFGYSWLWSTDCGSVAFDRLCEHSEEIFARYEREYSALGADGIYFQSATEMRAETIGGINVAEAVTHFVNHTAALFLRKYPDLELQFGLHATSVKNKLDIIGTTDPRIRIVWEDAGAFPFSYFPSDIGEVEKTKRFLDRIASLRGKDDLFGVVTKGLTKLDWSTFTHPDAPLCIGVCEKETRRERLAHKRKIWRYVQAYWIANADVAKDMIARMASLKDGDLYISGLLEDGMFEDKIFYPAALFAEMLWDPERDLRALMSETALRSYVEFI